MDTEAFIRWALDESRTVDQRYTVELLVELGVGSWNVQRKIFKANSFEETIRRSRERKLNPAYKPEYSEESLRKAVEYLAALTYWSYHGERLLRSLEALRFLTSLEFLQINHCAADLSPLATLPLLSKLNLTLIRSEDATPIGRCKGLRELAVSFQEPWPDFTGIGALPEIETLSLSGNLLALPPSVVFPKVRRALLICAPLAARSVADLPKLPACEFLTLQGASRLDGIEAMPKLRNLTLTGPFRSFRPIEVLKELTCLIVGSPSLDDPESQPRDITPVARLPKLHYFKIGPDYVVFDLPRDYSPFAESPSLRELVVQRCPPVEMEVAAINAGLQPWDDLFLAPKPHLPLPPLRMIVAAHKYHPRRQGEHLAEGESGLVDTGLRECEGRWVGAYAQRLISEKIGQSDWGKAEAYGPHHSLSITIESFDVVEKLPAILDATREIMACLRNDYVADFMIALIINPPELTPAQKQLKDQFRAREDEWQFEQNSREKQEYLDRLHQLELKQQQGAEIKPEEFSPSQRAPYPEAPWESEDQDADDEGDVAVKKKPEPPPSFFDDEHPLAENYRLMGVLTLEEAWFLPHQRGLAVHLMQREPDLEIPEEKKASD